MWKCRGEGDKDVDITVCSLRNLSAKNTSMKLASEGYDGEWHWQVQNKERYESEHYPFYFSSYCTKSSFENI